jgi:hypothetical protein
MLEDPGVVLYSEVCIRISCPGGVSAIPVHRDCSSLGPCMERNVTIPATSPMTMSHFLFRVVVMVVWFLKKAMVRLPSSTNRMLFLPGTPAESFQKYSEGWWSCSTIFHSSSSPEQNVSSQSDIAVGIESVGELSVQSTIVFPSGKASWIE